MKNNIFIILVFFVLHSIQLGAQNKQGYQWCWGKYAGLDFTLSPPTIYTHSLNSIEAASSVSDEFGNLLFYSNGCKVWDKNGNLMPNGTGIIGNACDAPGENSSTSGTVITPVIGSCGEQYYVFSHKLNSIGSNRGLYYYVVDMTLQGNGIQGCPLGEVVPGYTRLPTPVNKPLQEAVTTIIKPNGIDYWVIVRSNDNDIFYAFEVTAAGVKTPAVQSGLADHSIDIDGSTGLFLSPSIDGNSIVETCRMCPSSSLNMYDFDNTTGKVSNGQVITLLNEAFNEAAFSPDDKLIYAVTLGKKMYGYERYAANIAATETFIGNLSETARLQLAPDCKIYAFEESYASNGRIHVLNDPNSLTNPDLVANQFLLPVGTINRASAPNIFHGYKQGYCSSSQLKDTLICEGESIVIGDNRLSLCNAYEWTPSTGLNDSSLPVVTASPTVTTTYTLIAITPWCDTVEVGSLIIKVDLDGDATINGAGPFCNNDNPVILSAADPGGNWSATCGTCIDPATGQFDPNTAGAGTHQVIYTISGACGDADTINLNVVPLIINNVSASICAGDSILLGGSFQTSTGVYNDTTISSGGCDSIVSTTLTVNLLADASITPAGDFCSGDPSLILQAQQNGGNWSGNGIINFSTGEFNPGIAGAGTHQVIYTISGSCGDADTTDLLVEASPEASLLTTDDNCEEGKGSISINTLSGNPPYSYQWNTGSTDSLLLNLLAGDYTLIVSDSAGCTSSYQATVNDFGLNCGYLIYLPNIFSPNGDGENEVLYVRGKGIQSLQLIVYNRWGNKVFETSTMTEGWDGTYKGKRLNSAVFTYYIIATFANGQTVEEKGNVSLVN